MSDLKKRLLSGSVYVLLVLFSIWFSKETYIALIFSFSVISLFEFSKLISLKQTIVHYILLLSVIYTVFSGVFGNIIIYYLVFTVISSLGLIYSLFQKNSTGYHSMFNKLAISARYIVFPFVFLMLLPLQDVNFPLKHDNYNSILVLFVIVSIWVNDSFAYLVGKNFGKNKLFERISPKKTIEGFIGGLFFTILLGVFFGLFVDGYSILNGVVLAVIVSFFGTIGDLVESMFKRQAGVKDSGTIMPGHGGILDRLDSLFFLAPFVYVYINYLT